MNQTQARQINRIKEIQKYDEIVTDVSNMFLEHIKPPDKVTLHELFKFKELYLKIKDKVLENIKSYCLRKYGDDRPLENIPEYVSLLEIHNLDQIGIYPL